FGNAGLIERSTVFPYAFPRDFKTLLAYALGRRTAAHYHLSALPSLLPWMWRYWQHSSPALYPQAVAGALPLIEHSWSEHQPLINAAGAHDLVNERGWIKIFRTQQTAHQVLAMAENSRAYGVPALGLSPSELLALEPALKNVCLGGVHYPDARQIQDPQALSSAYLRLFEQRGGRFMSGDARSLQAEGHAWSVQTEAGRVTAVNAVLALGPWGEDMARQLGYRLSLGRKRGYHMHFQAPALSLKHTVVDSDNGYAIAPMRQGLRLTTGAEFALRDAPSTPVQLQRIEPLARALTELGGRVDAKPWLGSRPCTPDMLPLVGPAPAHPGLWFSFGHAHHGLTQAASSGRLLSELICGEETYIDPTPYRVQRLA
ncbi:MAG: FAD-binding oxidoreductase, partial [Burkholderiales bacterium]|nr:FAD-binding oxidoreductase [Burkholderiales bacterium]